MTIKNDTRKEDFLKQMAQLGAEHGEGMVSRPKAAEAGLNAAIEGLVGPTDAKEVWSQFQQASAKAKGMEYKQEGSFTQQVSKFKKFLTLGAMSGGIDPASFMERAVSIIKTLAKDDATRKAMGGSLYDKMVAVAAAQIKAGDAQELSDEEIRDILLPHKAERDEEAILKSVAKTLSRVVEGGKDGQAYPSPQSEQALKHVNDRLHELANPATATPPDADEADEYEEEPYSAEHLSELRNDLADAAE